jgi:flagellum-specific peptidoglycan hydrolase FlgJ
MCFSSTAAMAIKYLNPTALLGSNADDDYLKRVLRYGDTTEATAHLRAAFDYGIKATFLTNGTRTTLEKELDAGYPVACGILQKEGYATDPKYPQKLITLIKENN